MDHSAHTSGGALSSRSPSDRARVLLEINNAIVAHLDLVQVLKAVSAALRREIKHDFAGLALYNAESRELRLHALDFPNDQTFMEQGQLIPLQGTPAGVAFATRKAVLRHRPDFEEFNADITRQAYDRGIRSGCAVPLICRDKIVGSMVVASLHESAFTEDDAELLTQIGTQVAIAVDNALNYERLRCAECEVVKERDRTRLLLEINNAVVSHLDLRELVKSISRSLRQIVPHDAAFLTLFDREGTRLRVQALDLRILDQVPFEEGVVIARDGTPEGEAIASGHAVLVVPTIDLVRFHSPWVRNAANNGIKSGCAVPLIAHGRTLGALSVVSQREAAFHKDHAQLLEECSGQIAIAVENALNFESARGAEREAKQERDRSRLLLEVNNAVVSHLNLSELLKSISARLGEAMSNDSAFIALCGPDNSLQVLGIDVGKLEDVVFKEGFRIPMEGTPEEDAIKSGQPVLVRSTAEFLKYPSPWVRYAVDHGLKSGCINPLITHGRTLGALGVVSLREDAFTPEAARLLGQISGQIAIAVENALNFEKSRQAERVAKQERDRSKLLLDINNALVSHLDLHDLVKVISTGLRQILHHDFVGFSLYDPETGKMFARALESASDAIIEGIQYDLEGTVTGLSFTTGTPVYLPRPDQQRFPSSTTRNLFEAGMKTLYSVPVTVHGRKLGGLIVASSREDALTEDDRQLFQEISKQVGIAAVNALAVRDLEDLKNKLAQEKLYLEDEIRNEFNFEEIIGKSPALREVLRLVNTVAASDSTVLLLGETGTGKELIARAVHDHSRRKGRTFVKLNCAAIPTGLLESELFGHEKGAFTGAIAQKIGRLELADQGTLFLDEVGDIPVEIQPKLLRALQEREFERLGSTHTKKVNVRLVAATNRNLEKMIEERQFRSDLYYRLNVFPIRIPPLRERQEDIPLLVRYFTERFARQMQKPIESIPADTMASLQRWQWPGNVRELENLIERAVILTGGSVLQVPLPEVKPPEAAAASVAPEVRSDGAEREHIIKVLRETRGVLAGPNGAASRLGLKRTTLQYKMKKLGIKPDHWWPTS
ncbi:MAG TPA: sigma 54-interacting transcriptional regulator [Terriglobales bacterium]